MMNMELSSDALGPGLQSSAYRLPASTSLGRARLAVSDLSRSVDFYSETIGLFVLTQSTDGASLGTADGQVLLELEELAGVGPLAPRSRLGLYHTAFLLPNRESLSSFIRHLYDLGTRFGASDHGVSEALYLVDPDGLSVEVYADRDRALWVIDRGEITTPTSPLLLADLLANESAPWEGIPTRTVLGHLHFYVGDIPAAAAFYHGGLGMDKVSWRNPSVLFVSAGGYHHHVGLNTWAAGTPQASAYDARILRWELILPSAQEVHRAVLSMQDAGFLPLDFANPTLFSDPWGITVSLVVGNDPKALASATPLNDGEAIEPDAPGYKVKPAA